MDNIERVPSFNGRQKLLQDLREKRLNTTEYRQRLVNELGEKTLVNSQEACELLGISLTTFRNSIKRGRITPIYIGRYLRFTQDDIEKYIGTFLFITIPEAAKILNVSTLHVRNLIRNGAIKAIKEEKGQWKIHIEEVQKFIK